MGNHDDRPCGLRHPARCNDRGQRYPRILGETGIEGVTVLLDDGPCPGEDGWSTTTDAEGQYGFYDLSAGTYCLEVPTLPMAMTSS